MVLARYEVLTQSTACLGYVVMNNAWTKRHCLQQSVSHESQRTFVQYLRGREMLRETKGEGFNLSLLCTISDVVQDVLK